MKWPDYLEIDLELLRIDTILGFDLFLPGPRGLILYRSRNVPFNERVRQNLLYHGVKSLYMPARDIEKYTAYIENNLSNIIADPNVKIETKCQLLYDTSVNIAKELLLEPTSLKAVKRSAKAVENMVDLYLKDEGGIKKIIELMPEDYKLYTHSTNVATLSIAIGRSLGVFSKADLYELGLGALLHDIGKSQVPQAILLKPGPLTPDEFETVKQHVRFGCYMVEGNPIVPRQALIPIMWHHERLSGEGYPLGKGHGEIPLFGMVTAVADSFDAMTSNRVYQKAMSSFKAMEVLMSETNSYDPRVVKEMLKLLGPSQTKPKEEVALAKT
jgi:putative nucleotidyltransferase with HDIG domain